MRGSEPGRRAFRTWQSLPPPPIPWRCLPSLLPRLGKSQRYPPQHINGVYKFGSNFVFGSKFVFEKRLSREHMSLLPLRKACKSASPTQILAGLDPFPRGGVPAVLGSGGSALLFFKFFGGICPISPSRLSVPRGQDNASLLSIPLKRLTHARNIESSINSHLSTPIHPPIHPSGYVLHAYHTSVLWRLKIIYQSLSPQHFVVGNGSDSPKQLLLLIYNA